MKVTIADIARACGLGISTVSRALNNQPEVSPRTRERVRATARELGYMPNDLARGLVSRHSRTLGLLLPNIADPFFPEIARGVEDAASRQGFHVIYANTDRQEAKEQAAVKHLLQKQVEGLIITGDFLDSGYLEMLQAKGIPFVLLRRKRFRDGVSFIDVDNRTAAAAATRHLIQLGHRRIAMINLPVTSYAHADRLAGYRDAMAEAGLRVDPALLAVGDYQSGSGRAAVERWLDLAQPPTAVFASNDMMAIGVLDGMAERGLRAPQDLAVIGFDGLEVGALRAIGLSTMAQPRYEMGERTIELLLSIIIDGSLPERQVILPIPLLVRRTCGGDGPISAAAGDAHR